MSEYKFTGGPHLTARELVEMFDKLEAEGLTGFIFYDGYIKTANDWLNFLASMPSIPIRALHQVHGVVGMGWLNGFYGNTAMFHFGMFGKDQQQKLDLSRSCFRWLANNTKLESLYGLTPSLYRNVFPFIEQVGWEIRGPVAGACYMARRDKHYDGVISVLNLSRYDDSKCDGGG